MAKVTSVTDAKKDRKQYPLVLGKPIRLRRFQLLIWTGMSALLGVGFIAGLYWLAFQQKYPWGSAKGWWDGGMGFIHSGNWALYRHSIRDNGEPEFWALMGGILMGKATVSQLRAPLRLVPLALLTLLAAVVASALAIAWIANFGPLRHVSDTGSLKTIVLAFIAGQLLHILYRPVGASIRYHLITRSLRTGSTPLWVSLPLRPPTWRELWSELKASGTMTAETASEQKKRRGVRMVISLGVFAFIVIAVIGILAKYGVAHGLHVPVMNP